MAGAFARIGGLQVGFAGRIAIPRGGPVSAGLAMSAGAVSARASEALPAPVSRAASGVALPPAPEAPPALPVVAPPVPPAPA
jgi:hypothetical protein